MLVINISGLTSGVISANFDLRYEIFFPFIAGESSNGYNKFGAFGVKKLEN